MNTMTMRRPIDPELISHADDRLVRTVDGLTAEALAGPSLLPGWTRAHVVAHLTLNGEGLERVLRGQHVGEPATMYDSQEARDADIEELAGADPSVLRERLLAATTCFSEAVAAMTDEDWQGRFERTPGGQDIAVAAIPLMRLREVEIHHADLASDYTAADWPPEFTVLLIDSARKQDYSEPFRVHARDLDREWSFGVREDVGGGTLAGGPVVTGDAAALGWWLTGRGSGDGLSCDAERLPRIGAW